MLRVVFVGDTSLRASHFGCQLVGQTIREQLSRVGLHLIAAMPTRFVDTPNYKAILDQADLVIVNGEGSIHHGRHLNMIRLAAEYPCALINCVYQENPRLPELQEFRYIATRESMSAEAIRAHGVECHVVPDVLFDSALLNSYIKPAATQPFGFTDNVRKSKYGWGPISIKRCPGFSPNARTVAEYLRVLSRYERLCIGRFHAAIAASVLEIPFATWDSNTWKTAGMMRDMGVPHLHCRDRKEARRAVPSTLDPRIRLFAQEARIRIRTMFDQLARIAANPCERAPSHPASSVPLVRGVG